MAAITYLDTHVVAWLYQGGAVELPAPVSHLLYTAQELRVSPMVRLELEYLYEVGRVSRSADAVMEHFAAILGIVVCSAAFSVVAREAERHSWTRDPFDRLITANAAIFDAVLVSKDESIRQHYGRAWWSDSH